MDYSKHYSALMMKAKMRENLEGYSERHHITPRCMGGNDCVDNLVMLTPEEHFTAHLLLVKIHPQHRGLAWAALRMCGNPHGQRSNKTFGWLRRKHSCATSLRMKGNTINTGRIQSQQERKARSEALTGYVQTEQHKKNTQAKLAAQRLVKGPFRQSAEAKAKRTKGPCTIDGIMIYANRAALVFELGYGNDGVRHPNFRYQNEF